MKRNAFSPSAQFFYLLFLFESPNDFKEKFLLGEVGKVYKADI